jgi:hypothetical protein
MKTTSLLASAALIALGLVTSHAAAQGFQPGKPAPAFKPHVQVPRPDPMPFYRPTVPYPSFPTVTQKKEERNFGSSLHWLSFVHAASAARGSGSSTKIPAGPPELSAAGSSAARGSWFRGCGGGTLAGIGAGIAGLFGALFGRKKNTDS